MELKIKHLRKQFKDKNAVDDVCLTLTPGVWGLLGANGAGKTTLMRMIAGIMTPTSGVIQHLQIVPKRNDFLLWHEVFVFKWRQKRYI